MFADFYRFSCITDINHVVFALNIPTTSLTLARKWALNYLKEKDYIIVRDYGDGFSCRVEGENFSIYSCILSPQHFEEWTEEDEVP